jgi:Tfp pilus assembly protein PilX
MTSRRSPKKSGHILVFVLAVLGIIFILTTIAFQLIRIEAHSVNRSYVSRQALNLAEAGIERAIRELNGNAAYPGEAELVLGNGVLNITVSGTGKTRTIQATGTVPNSTNPIVSRTVKAEASLDSENVEFFYGIQVDGGGLDMTNDSVVNGNVYSNGNVIGANGALITGDVTVAGGLNDNPSVSQTDNDANQFFATAKSNQHIAQPFIATATETLPKVSVLLSKVGNPTSNLTVRITADGNSKPGSVLATSVIPASAVGATASWIGASFVSAPTVNNGARYWIVLSYNSNSNSNHWNWRKKSGDGSAGGLADTGMTASGCCSNNQNWSGINGHLAFQAWLGGQATRIDGMIIGSNSSGVARANQFVNTTVHGSSCPNAYCLIENPSPEILPISDGLVQDWKQQAASGGTHSGDYILDGTSSDSLGPKKIEGDLILRNTSILTVTGTLWVTGNISLENSSRTQLHPGYGANSGIIIADGTITTSNSATFGGAGIGSYVLMLSDRDAKTQTSIFVNNASVGVIYYAGKSWINFANASAAKEATAWGISLGNGASVTYESGLANTNFTSGPGGGWRLKKGTWRQLD